MIKRKTVVVLATILILIATIGFFTLYLYRMPVDYGIATLTWDKNQESDLAGYKIYYGTNPRNGDCPPGGYDNIVDVGQDTKYVLNNLTNGKTYYFSITSYNTAKQESCFSKEGRKIISAPIFSERIKQILNK